jgi:hypothetical protein
MIGGLGYSFAQGNCRLELNECWGEEEEEKQCKVLRQV